MKTWDVVVFGAAHGIPRSTAEVARQVVHFGSISDMSSEAESRTGSVLIVHC
jgi:hypothetical protein